MPSLYHLNSPPNPFWTFVHDLEDHPFFAGRAGPPGYTSAEHVAPEAAEASGSNEQARAQQPTVEDPPEVDPATLNANTTGAQPQAGPFHGRGRFPNTFQWQDGPHSRRGYGCRGRGGHAGPAPFTFGGGPWWARHVPGMDNPEHPHPQEDPHHGPGPHHHHGPPMPHHHHGPPPPPIPHHQHGPPPPAVPHHGPGPHHHRDPPGPRRGRGGFGFNRSHSPPSSFNLGQFLNNLGNRLGVDLSGAAENMGLDRFTGPRGNGDADFEPRGDIFDTKTEYLVHLSLPGAKKSDVGVDWDGENSVLRIAGVVHRPGADEELLSQLVVDQRKREVGVFEKNIRLGTRRDPANVDIAGISAKMCDGVLVVRVPKVEGKQKKREVSISGSSGKEEERMEPSTAVEKEREKENLLDAADEEMYDAAAAAARTVPAAGAGPAAAEKELSEKEQIAAHAYQQEQNQREQDVRSETMDVEHDEKAPAYEESDWERDGSEDEGEYVKINVD